MKVRPWIDRYLRMKPDEMICEYCGEIIMPKEGGDHWCPHQENEEIIPTVVLTSQGIKVIGD